MFSNLHQHTDYSLRDGFATIPELVRKAKELGYPALAITDHGTVTGAIAFYDECKKQGVKPILGCEFYYTNEITVKDSPTYHLLILAKDNTGYQNLMKLDTYAHAHFYKKPRIGIEALEKYHEGLICTTACVAGPLSSDDPEGVFNDLLDVFGSNDLYVEIQPHDFPEQIAYNEKWKDHFPVKTIITLDSHYVNKEDVLPHKLWLHLDVDSSYYASNDYYLRTEGEVVDWFNKYGIDARPYIENVQEIVDKCNVEIVYGEQHYPNFTDNPGAYVKEKCNEGYRKLKISKLPNHLKYLNQVRHEYDVLEKLDYLNYFCIIDDMLRHCRETGIPTGMGRGSVCGSLVAYLMGITQIDPIKYHLVFERFANPERVTPPDVDTDVATSRRDELIQYIKEKYGEVYQVRTENYVKDKASVQRAAQSIDDRLISQFVHDAKEKGFTLTDRKGKEIEWEKATRKVKEDVPFFTYKYPDMGLENYITPTQYTKVSKNVIAVEDMPAGTKFEAFWKKLALTFRGHIINYGCHASAVLVSPEDITRWTAVEKQGDYMVVCHDFHQLEAQGLLKLDILGLETLDIIEATKHRAGIHLDAAKVPTDDKKTAAILRAGHTGGCFQIESNVMTSIIRRMRVQTVEDLVAVVALGRPGPLDSGMAETFLKRRNGQEKVIYDIPDLEPILKDTEGVIVYQEQIMQIARKLCGYSLGEADNLRRIIGRKVKEEMQPAVEDMIKRGVQNGYSEKQMKEVTDNIITFASYGFNRGHSAAYGLTAWVTAYLKAHYPAEFMASIIEANRKDKAKLASYVLQAKNMGIRVIPPKVNHKNCYSGYNEEGSYIILGLDCIAGVGNIEIAENSPAGFKDFLEAGDNLSINKRALENMVKAGVFQGNRDKMIQYVAWAKDKRKSKPPFEYVPTDYNEQQEESKVLGVSFGDIFKHYDLSITNHQNIVGYEVVEVKARKTRAGKPMAFVKVRDNWSVTDLVIFNDEYKKIKKNKVYIFKLRKTQIVDFVEAKYIA